ncbi:MAG: endolytic transglycosylase MltG [Candidatus Hydrogenedentota bacterium]
MLLRLLATSLLILMVLAGCVGYLMIAPPSGGPRTVTIPPDVGPDEIAVLLADARIIATPAAYSIAANLMKRSPKPGRYVFSAGVYPWVAVRILSKGPPPELELTVTVPEGKRLEEIATILDAAGITNEREFLRGARDRAFIRELIGSDQDSLEGYLFPDTYKFKPNSDVLSVIRRMHQRFTEQSSGLANPRLSMHEFVTLASIVEREARVPQERPRIAAVYLNRLRIGMKLDADPTVRYAVNKWDTTPVLYVDLESRSPYNTYRVPGLPPGPICSPGRASLDAVAHPLESRELFFVAQGDGSHIFSESFRDHLAHVAAVRRTAAREAHERR